MLHGPFPVACSGWLSPSRRTSAFKEERIPVRQGLIPVAAAGGTWPAATLYCSCREPDRGVKDLKPQQLTELLTDWRERPEDASVAEALARLVYDDLRAMAARRLSDTDGAPVSPTELVHEAWLRLDASKADFNDRYHFFRLAALCMRQLLVDLARQRQAAKRGADFCRVTLERVGFDDARIEPEVLDLNRALAALEVSHARHAELALLHCFGGLSLVEIAELNGTSRATAKRDWKFARAWLLAQLKADGRE